MTLLACRLLAFLRLIYRVARSPSGRLYRIPPSVAWDIAECRWPSVKEKAVADEVVGAAK